MAVSEAIQGRIILRLSQEIQPESATGSMAFPMALNLLSWCLCNEPWQQETYRPTPLTRCPFQPMEYLYLHGFASGPQSAKAQYLRQQFTRAGKTLHILDLNQDDFMHLTLSRQIEQAIAWIGDRPQVTVIGSSFGGLTACWLAEQPQVSAQIQQLMLLAPAFQFLQQWLPRLGPEAVNHWRTTGRLAVYHYGQQQQVELAYDFITDAQQYDEKTLKAALPTLIFHGRHDDVISIQASRDYAARRPWVQLIELDSDHTLGNVQATIWATLRSRL